jgi:hypothetical protein
MKRLTLVACAVAAILALPVRAVAQPAHADSPKVTLAVTQTMVAGTAVLQPGEYKFQCRTFDGKTFLVITAAETGKEIARVPCVQETLDAKVTDSDFRSTVRQDGKRQLISVRIKGEAVAHRIVD